MASRHGRSDPPSPRPPPETKMAMSCLCDMECSTSEKVMVMPSIIVMAIVRMLMAAATPRCRAGTESIVIMLLGELNSPVPNPVRNRMPPTYAVVVFSSMTLRHAAPASVTSAPVMMSGLIPSLSAMPPEKKPPTMLPIPYGISWIPAASGSILSGPCRKKIMLYVTELRTNPMSVPQMIPMSKTRRLKMAGGMSGSTAKNWSTMKMMAEMPPPTHSPVRAWSVDRTGSGATAWIIAIRISTSASMTKMAPMKSKRRMWSLTEWRTRLGSSERTNMARIAHSPPGGTLNQKIHRHSFASAPPIRGPSTIPRPENTWNTPILSPTLPYGAKALVMMAELLVNRSAAPNPITTRAPIRSNPF
mmetsp:Transcript_54650/g.144407  ORF Transcript_54650/g.144407 Transcript_54650/m.144407 type:complete len:360 (+) Transcript_54650:63-1142(+)